MKQLIHIAGRSVGDVQQCARCGATLRLMSKDGAVPIGTKMNAEGDRVESLNSRLHVLCSGRLDTVQGILPESQR